MYGQMEINIIFHIIQINMYWIKQQLHILGLQLLSLCLVRHLTEMVILYGQTEIILIILVIILNMF
jgi:hypothetical protein